MLDTEKITRWSDMDLGHVDLSLNGYTRNHESTPFPIDPVVNGRVALWFGDIFSLRMDGLTQMTNESLSDFPYGLQERTGPEYQREIRSEIQSIRTGDAKVIKSHPNLPCRHVILTVSPKYSEKYQTAAETALYSCYNNILQRSVERNLSSVGIPVLHTKGKSLFPDELGVHVAMRTVRRFLEKGYTYPNLIILCVPDTNLFRLYESLMVSYFPRDAFHEEYACSRIKVDIGDSTGSTYWPDRRIRIFSNPAENPNLVDGDDESNIRILPELNHDFITMKDDVDKERLLFDAYGRRRPSFHSMNDKERHIAIEIETRERHGRILRRAHEEDLTSIAKTGCLYRSGLDRLGRPVVVIVGKWFTPETIDLDKAFLYLVRTLDDINGPYTVIYFHARTEAENRPTFRWMRSVYDNMEYRFKKNLKSLCIVHPTMWTKVLTWWFTTFMAPAIKPKIQNVAGLQELFTVIEPGQLQLPAFISEHDITIHGFGGVAYSLNHSKTSTPTTGSGASTTPLSATTTSPFGI